MPASEIRLLALTRVRSAGISRGTVAARATPYALEQTRQPSTAGYISTRAGGDRVGRDQAEQAADREGAADRPATTVREPVEERPDQRRHEREREHGQAQEQRDRSAGAAGVGEEDGARERDRDRGVTGGVERVELDQPGEPGAAGTLGVRGPARPAERGRGGALARATGRGDAPAGRAERASTPPGNGLVVPPGRVRLSPVGVRGGRGVHGTILPSRPTPRRGHPPRR